MQVRGYRVLLREEPEGGYTVFAPALPGCVTYGENVAEAMAMAREAIELFRFFAHDTAQSLFQRSVLSLHVLA